jgi:hypothetical protein
MVLDPYGVSSIYVPTVAFGCRLPAAGGHAAQHQLGPTFARGNQVETGHLRSVIGEADGVLPLQARVVEHRYRHRHILQALAALVGGDDDGAQLRWRRTAGDCVPGGCVGGRACGDLAGGVVLRLREQT